MKIENRMNIRHILLFPLVAALFGGCGGGDYSPKPQAYLRIDMPEHKYFLLDTLCKPKTPYRTGDSTTALSHDKPCLALPFSFEANECVELREKDAPKGETWLDIMYPQWDGVVFLTYKRLAGKDDLRGQTDTSSRLLEKHYQFASGIDEQGYEDAENHFLRGALYINSVPNNDSLAPVLEYMQRDIDHLVETLRWR